MVAAIASVHGRFQLVHNQHMDVLLGAKERCDFLLIGITQPAAYAPQHISGAAPHRASRRANPLSYFERATLIRAALSEAGVDPAEFQTTPFPIESPELLPNYLGLDVPIYINVCEDWGRTKITLLRSIGYQVRILWENEKQISGEMVRQMILEDKVDELVEIVPAATLRFIEDSNLKERLLSD